MRQAEVIYNLLARINGRKMAEIGVEHGTTSQWLLQKLPSLHLTMVDPWAQTGTQNEIYRPWTEEYWESVYRHARQVTEFAAARRQMIRLPSLAAANLCADGQFDLIFIDAEHTYPAVSQDTLAWWPKVAVGGILSWHDYGHHKFPGVKEAVDEWAVKTGVTVEPNSHFVCWLKKN